MVVRGIGRKVGVRGWHVGYDFKGGLHNEGESTESQRRKKKDCVSCLEHTNIQAKLELETKPNVK